MPTFKREQRGAAALALLGFSLATMQPKPARASGTASGTTSSTASGLGSASAVTLTVSLVLVGVVAVGVAILIIYSAAKKKNERLPEPAPEPATDPAPRPAPDGDSPPVTKPRLQEAPDNWARLLLDAGILTHRTDLATEMAVLIESPAAHDQLSDEVIRGDGPALRSLAAAAGTSVDAIRTEWLAATEASGLVTDQRAAARLTLDFMAGLAPELRANEATQSDLLWELQRERVRSAFPSDAPVHDWVATWLGVPRGEVDAATAQVFEGEKAVTRAEVYADPEPLMTTLTGTISDRNPGAVGKRIVDMVDRIEGWLPEQLVSQMTAEFAASPG